MSTDEVDYDSDEFSSWFDKGKSGAEPPPRGCSATALEAWLMGHCERDSEDFVEGSEPG
jgi:hypothetical protein